MFTSIVTYYSKTLRKEGLKPGVEQCCYAYLLTELVNLRP